MKADKQPVIPVHFNLEHGVRPVTGQDGVACLEFSSSMHTLYWQTYGELSPFFQTIKDGHLIGSTCPQCGLVMVPPTTWNCPDCDFCEMDEVNLPMTGVLAATAPITIFPPANRHGTAPYVRGYVDVATGTDKASFLPAALETTTGLPRPGIFVKGVELQLVFRDERQGRITDIFYVPLNEVPEELRGKFVLASQLNFQNPEPPEIKHQENMEDVYVEALGYVAQLCDLVNISPRARKDLGKHQLTLGVTTSGGDFTILVADGKMNMGKGLTQERDFMIQAEDPRVFSDWVLQGSLTDAVVEGRLWLPNRAAFAILPMLDRLPRSTRRDQQEDQLQNSS